MNMQSHLKITKQQISPYVLLPGDPDRVNKIGTYLDNFMIIANNREFRVGIGKYKGRQITVCSTGIGCPSTAIAVEELINAGAKYLIRVGTCGGAWRSDIPAGTLIIPTASVRDEGTTQEYISLGFPAIANRAIVEALASAAAKMNIQFVEGINRTHDAFYGNIGAITEWGKYLKDTRWQDVDTPIISSEMESAALFVIAILRGVKAGAVFAVNANPEPLRDRVFGKQPSVIVETNSEMTKKVVENAISVSLEAMYSLTTK